MGCSACGSGSSKTLQYQVRLPSGTVRRYVSEAEARAAARKSGGTFEFVRR